MSEEKKVIPDRAPAQSIKIADRGAKSSLTDLIDDRDRWKKFCFALILVACFTSTNFLFGVLGLSSKVYVQSAEGELVELRELPQIPMTQIRVSSFMDDAVKMTLGLNFSMVDEQLAAAKKFFNSVSYQDIMEQLNVSNYIKNVTSNNLIISMTPVSDLYEAKILKKEKNLTLIGMKKAYMVSEQSGTQIVQRYYVVKMQIQSTNEYEVNPWGMFVTTLTLDILTPQEFDREAKVYRQNKKG